MEKGKKQKINLKKNNFKLKLILTHIIAHKLD